MTLTISCLPTSSDLLCCVISAVSEISNFAFKKKFTYSKIFFSDVQFCGFCTCVNSCNDHYGQDTEQFQCSKESLCSHFIFRLLPPLAPGNQWSLLCSYLFAFSRMSNKWNYIEWIFWNWLLLLNTILLQFMHVATWIKCVNFDRWVVFYAINEV